ncbi:MAG: PEP-CTERM sorting domain-containing protein [Pirellulales bacterium]|nr:PEP-CTERM sorting domain-containing protein [Pirellulales bacterium]
MIRLILFVCLMIVSVVVYPLSVDAAVVWDGGSLVDSSLATPENWVGDSLPLATDDVQFDGSVRLDPYTSGAVTYRSLAFNAAAGAFTVGGPDTISLTATSSTVVNNSTAAQTINAPLNMTANADIRATSGNLVLDDVTFAGTLKFYGDAANLNSVTVNGNLAGNGAITTSSGVTVLNADNTATRTTGTITVDNNSILRLTHDGAAGANDNSANSRIYILGASTDGGILELTGGITIDKWIQCQIRSSSSSYGDIPHIRNSGNNTLAGKLYPRSGGSYMNVESASGLLTISSTIVQDYDTATRPIRFLGDGNFKITGSLVNGTGTGTNGVWKIIKLGGGVLTYDTANINYTGNTGVIGGKLLLAATAANALDNSPNIFIDSGASLDVLALNAGWQPASGNTVRGGGSIVGDVVAASGATIRPGGAVDNTLSTLTETAGTLTVTGDLDMSAGAKMVWDLGALSEANPGTDFDTMAVSGELALGGTSQLELSFGLLAAELRPDYATPDSFWLTPHSWKIVDVGTNAGSTTFAGIAPVTTPEGWSFTTSVGEGDNAGDVYLNYVPEPSTYVLLLLAGFGLAAYARRRR